MDSARAHQSVQADIESFNADPTSWINALKEIPLQEFLSALITKKIETLKALDFETLNRALIQSVGISWLKKSFELRLHINQALANISDESKSQLIPFLRNLRQLEDYIGELAYNQPDRNAFDIDFKKVEPPILKPEGYSPYQLNPQYQSDSGFKFKAGDVIATRGISFISATISQMMADQTHFSHGVFVHENENGELQTIESYLQQGVAFYTIVDAMKNENARILVFRAKDQSLAARASQLMGDKLRGLQKAGHGIPYDYYMDHRDHSRMTCAEVIIASYEWASEGRFMIPYMQTPIRFKNPNVLKKFNIVEKETFSPVSMEIDPRFELVLDWRDFSLTRDQRQKDMILRKITEWMENRDYELRESTTTVTLRLIWSMRNTPLWKAVSAPFDLTNVPKETPLSFLIMVAQIREVGEILLQEVKKADQEFESKHGYPMTENRLLEFLKNFREVDLAVFKSGRKSKFHHLLRSSSSR